jgi:hypothetical protein
MNYVGINNDIPDLQVFNPGSSRGDYRLPCGYVDAKGKVFNRIYLREMTGVEDDILDDDELNVSERMTRVITNCAEKLSSGSSEQPNTIEDKAVIGAAVGDTLKGGGMPLTIPDRMAALLFIRRLSVGNIYRFERKCPECGKISKNKQVDLSTLGVVYCKDPTKRRVQVKLPRSGKVAVLKVLSASGERRVAEMRPTMKDVKTAAILARLETLDEKPLSGDDAKDMALVKGLPVADRRLIISTFNVMEGTIETEIELKCNSVVCGTEFKFDLDLGQVFFSNQGQEVTTEELNWL